MLPVPGLTENENAGFAFPFKALGEYDDICNVSGAAVLITKIPVSAEERMLIIEEAVKINEEIYFRLS